MYSVDQFVPRILLVRTRGRSTDVRAERLLREERGQAPRGLLLETTLGCDVLDEGAVQSIGGLRGKLYSRLPSFLVQAWEAKRRSSDYDVVMTWSERHSVAVAAVFAVFRVPTPHLAMMFWMSKPAVRWPLLIFRSGIDRIVTWSSVQRNIAIDRIGFASRDVVLLRHPVDLEFFHPLAHERNIIFSAGSTQRDFPTFVEAVRDLELGVRVAASLVVKLKRFRIVMTDVRTDQEWPSNFEVNSMSPEGLRASYAAARVVVVPLIRSDIDAGVNVILEAMAMGRPVIVSRTAGQVDVVVEGETGIFVPPEDSTALREAVETLLGDPRAAEKMGHRARTYVEKNHRLEDFIQHVRRNACEVGQAGTPRRAKLGVLVRRPS